MNSKTTPKRSSQSHTPDPAANSKPKPAKPAPKDATDRPASAQRIEEAKPAKAITLAQLADRYLKHLEAIRKSPGTLFSYSQDLRLALDYFEQATELDPVVGRLDPE